MVVSQVTFWTKHQSHMVNKSFDICLQIHDFMDKPHRIHGPDPCVAVVKWLEDTGFIVKEFPTETIQDFQKFQAKTKGHLKAAIPGQLDWKFRLSHVVDTTHKK